MFFIFLFESWLFIFCYLLNDFLWCNLEFFQKSLNFSSKSPHIGKSSQKSLIYSPFPLISFNFWLLKACGNPVDINSKFSELSCEVYVFFLKIIQLNVSVNVTIIIVKKIVENWPFGWCHFSGPCFWLCRFYQPAQHYSFAFQNVLICPWNDFDNDLQEIAVYWNLIGFWKKETNPQPAIFKVNNRNTRKYVWNMPLALNIFHTLFWRFYS